MIRYIFPLVILICLYPEVTSANEASWQRYVQSGQLALQRGRHERAEKQFTAALKDAEAMGEQNPRLAITLNLLGEACRIQGKFLKAEPLYQRALTLGEQSLGKENPEFTRIVKNYAKLHRAQGLESKADQLVTQYGL